MKKRPDWNQYFMLMAKLAASRSTCNSRPAGAVIVKNKRIIATGYNGAVSGAPHCIDQPDIGNESYCFRRSVNVPDADKQNWCKSNHCEANAIAQSGRVYGGSIYITLSPCYVCLKLIAAAGIKHIYYEHDYDSENKERDRYWQKEANEMGIETYQKIKITESTLEYILPFINRKTSTRRKKGTE